ncbi:CaiB/BaiF CoA transferase family protein [Rubrobacter indicoceani]|uniref:CaiB/BaiF CoA transferase family protein n=1 Tax=Rubrobacter indicoceani TaxID=2051957 RepID=UPI000E5B3333|nr:CaiB/BaiF CoA-transferase family protein [Rubrobacter indicoceani]
MSREDVRGFARRERPLEGLRVLEFGALIAGPFATRMMAEFGAEVIKVERPGVGDPLRNWRYVDRRTGDSLWWSLQSRNKKLITLNLGHPEGVELAKKLAASSDIVVENFKPGTLEKLGLGWEVLHELNRRLILVRVSGYGQTGPYRDKPGFANIGEAMGGIRYVTGEPDRPPVRSGISLGDSMASLYAVIGALMAVHARDIGGSGEGQVVDVALYEAVFGFMESMVPEYDVAGIVRERTGAALPGITPSNTYRTKDESYVAIGGNSDAIFKRLVVALGRPELADDPRFLTNADRSEWADDLDELIEKWTLRHTVEEIRSSLDRAAVPVGTIYSVADIVEDEHYRAREMLLEGDVKGLGPVRMPGLAPKLSATPGAVDWYGGELGSHNREVYGETLGLSPAEMSRLLEAGVI